MAIEAQSFYAGSIDVQVSKPLDAREYVKTKEDLIKPDTWTSLRGGTFLWKGMRTYVKDEGCWYELISEPYTEVVIDEENDIKEDSYQLLDSWKKLNNIAIDDNTSSSESTYSSSKIQNLIESINKFNIQVVETLPVTGEKFVIYLVPIQEAEPQEEPATQVSDTYNEYIWTTDENGESGRWELIGTTKVNLSDYYTKTEVDTIVSNIEDKDTTYTAGENIEIENNSISAIGYTFNQGNFYINENIVGIIINENRNDFNWSIPSNDEERTLISYVGSDENYNFNDIIRIGDKIIFYNSRSAGSNPYIYIECHVISIESTKEFSVDKKIFFAPTTTTIYKPSYAVIVKNNSDVYIKGIGEFKGILDENSKSLQEYLLKQEIKVVNVYELSGAEVKGGEENWPDADLYHYCDTPVSDIFFTEKNINSVSDDGLKPNKFYRWNNTINNSFHLSFDSSSYNEYSEYMAEFKIGITNTSLSFGKINGNNILFTDNSDLQTVGGKTYQLSVLNNIGILINA